MAATVSAWAKPGAWALDSEEHEAELLQEQKNEQTSDGGTDSALSDFPSLASAATSKPKKKSKGQTFSLQQFAAISSAKQPASNNKGLTPEELMALPTGPRQRSAEELDRSRLGGGFRSHGSSYDRPGRGSYDEQPRRPRDSNRDFAPSRADETDDWGAGKKLTVGNGFERRERGERGAFFSDSSSRADDVDNWAAKKSFVPSEARRHERRGGFESNGGGADTDNWTKKKEEEGRRFGHAAGAFDSLREKRGGGFEPSNGHGPDADSWGRKREEVVGGRPRLNLQPRTLPVGDTQQENGNTPKPKGSNPFGNARPREEVLKEKGQDPKEIEVRIETLKMKESAGLEPGKRSFGSGNRRGSFTEDRTERAWRKPEPVDARPPRLVMPFLLFSILMVLHYTFGKLLHLLSWCFFCSFCLFSRLLKLNIVNLIGFL